MARQGIAHTIYCLFHSLCVRVHVCVQCTVAHSRSHSMWNLHWIIHEAKMCVSNDAKIESISSAWQSGRSTVQCWANLVVLDWTTLTITTTFTISFDVCLCVWVYNCMYVCIVLACDIHIAFNAPWNASVATCNTNSLSTYTQTFSFSFFLSVFLVFLFLNYPFISFDY